MLPRLRFVNPHLTSAHVEIASRASLYGSDSAQSSTEEDDTTAFLDTLVAQNLPDLKHLLGEDVVNSLPRKRRKTSHVDNDISLFKLISSTQTFPISLLPPPPPPPVTREPRSEDDDSQAVVRRARALAAAVDGETVLREARTAVTATCSGSSSTIFVTDDIADSPLAVLEVLQPPRKTRPPVPKSMLGMYPYVRDPSAAHALSDCRANVCPITKVKMESPREKGRRHRRKGGAKEKPVARFWRPEPGWKGVCQGYGYGHST